MPKSVSIFQEQWWLQIAAGPGLKRVQVCWNGKEVASLSYMEQQRWGLRLLRIPPYTRTLGPTFNFPHATPAERVKNIRRATKELVEQLPKHAWFRQVLDPDDESAFSWAMCGFKILAEYTCRIEPNTDIDRLWSTLDKQRRKGIQQREKDLTVAEHGDMERFQRLAQREYSKGWSLYDFPVLQRLVQAALERDQAIILTTTDKQGQDVSSAILVWDDRILYFWAGTRDHEGAARGSKSLLVWHAIKFAIARGLTFDFDSYASTSGARFMASFSTTVLTRFIVTKETLPITLLLAAKARLARSS